MVMNNKISLALIMAALLGSQSLFAGDLERRQAKRIHDRLTGVNATTATIDAMEALLLFDDPTGKSAAAYAINVTPSNPEAASFYNVTLKNFAAPWTNEEQTVFTDLNDYSAMVIGAVRDGIDFRRILWDDLLYVGNAAGISAYSNSDNNHYVDLEALDPHPAAPNSGNLANPSILEVRTQSSVTGLDPGATAGIMTTRAASMAFYSDGTNRAMFRFTLMNHLCTDLEPLKDVSRTPDRVRQDVSRSPGGDSRIYLNSCVGCHAGMDGMAGAFAFYEWDYNNDKTDGSLVYTGPPVNTPGIVSQKHLINPDNFKPGYVTTNDSWVNYWRNGQNALLGWGPVTRPDSKGNETGNGAKSLGQELANSHAFAQCQVDKVFKAICLRGPNEFIDDGVTRDRVARDRIVNDFKNSYTYNLREVFTDVAAHCKGS